MKTSKTSRRKFLAGMGMAAGAAIIATKLKSISAFKSSKSAKMAFGQHAFILKRIGTLKPVQTISRVSGTARLPLASRPI